MANLKALIVAILTVAAAVGVYFGLNKMYPHVEEKGELPPVTASVDDVFSRTISEGEPLPAPKAPPPGAPPAELAQAGTQTSEPPPTQPTGTPAPAAAPSEPAGQPASDPMLVPEPAPAPAPKSQPQPAPQEAAPQPAPTPEPPATPAPKPEPKPAAPAPKPEPKPAPPKAEPKPAPAAPAAAAPNKPATDNARWWGDPRTQDPQRLNLSYAGQAAGQKAIALLFTGAFSSAGVANWIKVTDARGKTAPGHWELGTNPKMLVYKGLKPGRYTVSISADLKDAQGRKLGRKLSGPVTVQ